MKKFSFVILLVFIFYAEIIISSPNNDLFNYTIKGKIERVKSALSEGADVNARDKYGETALIKASRGCHRRSTDIISLLIEK